MKNKTFAQNGFSYCFVLTKNGWRNQGMTPDNNRIPFITEYKQSKGSRVCFIPFCWSDNPNVMSDSDVYSYADYSA